MPLPHGRVGLPCPCGGGRARRPGRGGQRRHRRLARGDGADPRTISVLEAAGYEQDHRARRFRSSWFARLDLVIALDAGHLRDLRALAPTAQDAAKVRLLRSYDPAASTAETDVPDPYYGPLDGFEECLELVEAASPGLLDAVRAAVKEPTP